MPLSSRCVGCQGRKNKNPPLPAACRFASAGKTKARPSCAPVPSRRPRPGSAPQSHRRKNKNPATKTLLDGSARCIQAAKKPGGAGGWRLFSQMPPSPCFPVFWPVRRPPCLAGKTRRSGRILVSKVIVFLSRPGVPPAPSPAIQSAILHSQEVR